MIFENGELQVKTLQTILEFEKGVYLKDKLESIIWKPHNSDEALIIDLEGDPLENTTNNESNEKAED